MGSINQPKYRQPSNRQTLIHYDQAVHKPSFQRCGNRRAGHSFRIEHAVQSAVRASVCSFRDRKWGMRAGK